MTRPQPPKSASTDADDYPSQKNRTLPHPEDKPTTTKAHSTFRVFYKGRGIDSFFKIILGSPTEKQDNIAALLSDFKWARSKSVYIGDSNNDLEAAKTNDIDFIGRSSGLVDWEGYNVKFVSDLSSLYNFLH